MILTPSRLTLAVGVVVTLILLTLGWRGYARTREPLNESIATLRERLSEARAEQVRQVRLEETLQELAQGTLGADRETVDHELRSRLNRLGEQIGLSGLVVNTTRFSAKQSPAKRQLSSRGERELQDAVDFVELEGSIAGEGTLAQAIELVNSIQTAPWHKRVDQVSLHPRDNGDRFEVSVRLTTLFIPAWTPSELPVDPERPPPIDAYVALVDNNPFRLPPPPVVETPTPQVTQPLPQPPPSRFPYADWMITGVVDGPGGPEVWLRNRSSAETRQLTIGQRIHDLEFISSTGEAARFRQGDQEVQVRVGQSLATRVTLGL
jgi:hypothetical protein